MGSWQRRLVGFVALATLVGGTVACRPSGSRPVLTVNTTEDGFDAMPGDGICGTDGVCSLRAAFDEGNALGVADLVVPAGDYTSLSTTVTGDLRINWGSPRAVRLGGMKFTVATGGRLGVDGVSTYPARSPLWFEVNGALELRHSTVVNLPRATTGNVVPTALVIASGGRATVVESVVFGARSVDNGGGLVVSESLLVSLLDNDTLLTGPSGSSVLWRTGLVRPGSPADPGTGSCVGTPPVSLGHVHIEIGCGSAPAAGDSNGPAHVTIVANAAQPFAVSFGATSPLVDSIPVGTGGCDATDLDLYGNPRAVDGDGDGTIACDVGPVELQPDPPPA